MKVLIISHTPITTHESMGKTLLSLFSAFEPRELCQLYIYPSLPDLPACGAYYRITDKDVLNSYPFRRVRGEETFASPAGARLFENREDEPLYRNRKNKTPLRMLLRDAMWRFSRWYSKELRAFIQREKPSVLFVAPGAAKFLYDIALRIARDYHLPIVTYICDDFYFVKPPRTLLGRLQLSLLRKKIRRLLGVGHEAVVICPELKAEYEKIGASATVLMTGASGEIAAAPREKAPSGITYMGNIRCNRYRSLLEIGEALDRLNEKNGTDFTLDIYGIETDESILSTLRGARSIRFHGFVSGEEYERVYESAGLFLHAEAFDAESIDLVRHSVSTKIADCLASGVPLLAYGPAEIASMRHLLGNNCAICATSRQELDDALSLALFDGQARAAVVENALHTAKAFHDRKKNSELLRDILNK